MVTGILSLPPELLDLLFTNFTNEELLDNRVSQVNKLFQYHVERQLYRNVSIKSAIDQTPPRLFTFLRVLLNRPELAQYIHHLELLKWEDIQFMYTGYMFRKTTRKLLNGAISKIPTLELPDSPNCDNRLDRYVALVLNMAASNLQTFTFSLPVTPAYHSNETLQILNLDTAYEEATYLQTQTPHYIFALLGSQPTRFPKLHTIATPSSHHDTLRSILFVPWGNFANKHYAVINAYPPAIIYPLLALPSLRNLHISNLGIPSPHTSIPPIAPHLLSLRLTLTFLPPTHLPSLLRSTPSLKTLYISNLALSHITPLYDPTFYGPSIASTLPTSIETLFLTLYYLQNPYFNHYDSHPTTAPFFHSPLGSLQHLTNLKSLTISLLLLTGLPHQPDYTTSLLSLLPESLQELTIVDDDLGLELGRTGSTPQSYDALIALVKMRGSGVGGNLKALNLGRMRTESGRRAKRHFEGERDVWIVATGRDCGVVVYIQREREERDYY